MCARSMCARFSPHGDVMACPVLELEMQGQRRH